MRATAMKIYLFLLAALTSINVISYIYLFHISGQYQPNLGGDIVISILGLMGVSGCLILRMAIKS